MVIGLSGRKGSGKDTAGEYLVNEYGFTRASFAQPLKDSAAALFGIDASVWETAKNDASAKITLDFPATAGRERIIKRLSARELLQRYGTEAHRDIFGASFWTDQLLDTLGDEDVAITDVVITDCRFENETIATKEGGGVIVGVVRPGKATAVSRQKQLRWKLGDFVGRWLSSRLGDWIEGEDEDDVHVSEETFEALWDFTIVNDGSIEDLYSKLDQLMYDTGKLLPEQLEEAV